MNTKAKFIHIQKELLKIGISIALKTLKEFPSGGIANKLYTVESNRGKLLVHISTSIYEEQLIQRVHEKTFYLSKVLQHHKSIPTAKVFLSGYLSKNEAFSVQEYIEGQALGDRILKGKKAVNRYFLPKEKYLKQLERMIARLHEIEMNGFGFLVVKGDVLQGRYKDWLTFLKEGSKTWLGNIYKPKSISHADYARIKQKLASFFERYKSHFTCPKGRLIHGDMINPGNVLISNTKIIGIVDFEWALSGDPPWEFAFTIEDNLDDYFKYFEKKGIAIDRKEFQMKRELYRVLWLLWAANVHAKGGLFKDFLLSEFKKELDKFC